MTTATPPLPGSDQAALAGRFERYADDQSQQARVQEQLGDLFQAELKRIRSTIRHEAAELVRAAPDLLAAARTMHENAARHRVRHDPPIIGFDAAAADYTRARTWQACAQDVDPTPPRSPTPLDLTAQPAPAG